jgi:predicted secreted protein
MSLVSGVMIYAVLWWLVLFMVLPFGVRTVREEGGEVTVGEASSAPAKPRIVQKMLVTTLISGVIMALIVALIELEVFDFRGYFMPPA